MDHSAWLQSLSYQIAAYKNAYNAANPSPTVSPGQEKIIYWYRRSPAAAGSTDATGNNCPSAININGYQTCYAPSQILQDEVFAIVLASAAGTATISIGGQASTYDVVAGLNNISKPFNGATGRVEVSMGGVSGFGVDIEAAPAGGVANFNAIVFCAGFCL
jgi:hypothetical protein